ncbi:GNAT family N-acetyltransferase [Peribacillus simplex]|uniref:GNAT family N-acetyltransferase n=1 Tax=Peribacillus simplex TaxID=1478 RepID=UPI002989B70F|nr:GNAT family N-acetyltransferase [Peribacillus simplex]MBX9954130.1 GNAT family N-acetyltransferase [Peribacillus simplex]
MVIKQLEEQMFEDFRNELTNLLRENYLINFPNIVFDEMYFIQKTNGMFNYIKAGKANVFIAMDECVCGLVWILEREFIFERRLHINEIVVGEKFRSGGIGKELVEKVLTYANEIGISKVDLNMTVNNRRAFEFYKKMGFNIESQLLSLDI